MRRAFEVAESAQGYNGKNKTGAVIVVGNRVVSEGRNSEKSHPFARTFSKHPDSIYLHAEHDAILKASRKLGNQDWNKARLYVARTTRVNHFGIAKPCNGCAAAIEHFNIQHICYSLDAGPYLSFAYLDRKQNQLFITQEIRDPE